MVGFGGLAHVHASALAIFEDVQVTCICDIDPKKFEAKNDDINFEMKKEELNLKEINCYEKFEEMLGKEEIDILVSALPTDIHADYAVMALNKGINVFSEKPMAISVEACQKMIDAKNISGKELMIGQCVRFWPEYEFLKSIIENGRYGKLWSVIMQRCGCYPRNKWFLDGKRSGGALLDLHVHDVDWVNYVFGPNPDFMSAVGSVGLTGRVDDINSIYKYGNTIVTVRGSWMQHVPFHCNWIANFESASMEYRGEWEEIRITDKDSSIKETVKISKPNAYNAEMRYFIDTVKGLHKNEKCTPESTLESIKMALKEEALVFGK